MTPDPDPDDIPDDERATGRPIADKGEMSAPMHGTERPADGLGDTPGVSPDTVDAVADTAGRRELDFEEGVVADDAEVTQGESVVEAEYADRGPAEHVGEHPDRGVDADAAADIGDASAGDRLTGTDLAADADEDTPLPRVDDR